MVASATIPLLYSTFRADLTITAPIPKVDPSLVAELMQAGRIIAEVSLHTVVVTAVFVAE